MTKHDTVRAVLGAAAATTPILLSAAAASAGAVTGDYGLPSAANASAPSGPLGAALEPWLVTWILPVGGIIAVAVAGAVDRAAQAGYRSFSGRRPVAGRTATRATV